MENRVDHVEGDISGPAHSSVETVDAEEDIEDAELTRNSSRPVVDGSPYSLAMQSNMDPIVG